MNPGADPSATLGTATEPLTLDELEIMNDWILQGAPVNACQ